jgi:hypothetical protein
MDIRCEWHHPHTAKGWLYGANIDNVAHVIIHNLIEAEDVRGCFDERAS